MTPEPHKMTQHLNQLMNEQLIKAVLLWIPGHTGRKGSEIADTLATQGERLSLYHMTL